MSQPVAFVSAASDRWPFVTIELPDGLPPRAGNIALVYRQIKAHEEEAMTMGLVVRAAQNWSMYLRSFGFELAEGGMLGFEGDGVRFAVVRTVLTEYP